VDTIRRLYWARGIDVIDVGLEVWFRKQAHDQSPYREQCGESNVSEGYSGSITYTYLSMSSRSLDTSPQPTCTKDSKSPAERTYL
jgi:hypothetical protein